jgi:tetratricopeptide (TPR) repeat protein
MRQVKPEIVEDLIEEQITLGEIVGLNGHDLYEIAQIGYRMFISGRLEEAKQIYEGLISANPYDSVFHCHLATIYYYLNQLDLALNHYDRAIKLNRSNVEAIAGRIEAYLTTNQHDKALKDFETACLLDPKQENPSTKRASTLLALINFKRDRQYRALEKR